MLPRSKHDSSFRPLVIVLNVLALVGALASMFVVLVRVPALSSTKLEALFGTLQGTAVGLLFALLALLINLIYIVYRTNRPLMRAESEMLP
jgi:hypothetical protein